MGVVKGDRLGRSGKLAKLPLQSALAYAWVVSVPRARDDFGAFQWDPGSLRAACFPLRPEVTTEQVEGWLREWLEAGLLVCYTDSDGVELGCFTNFQGEPRPRFHRFELPEVIAHVCRPSCKRSGMRILKPMETSKFQRRPKASEKPATRGRTRVNRVAPSPPLLLSSSPPRVTEEQNLSGADAPGGVPATAKPARETWLTGYGEDWRARWGIASEPPWGEMAKSLRPGHEEHGEPALREAWRRFLASKEAAEYARPSRFREGLGQWLNGGAPPPARAAPPGHSTVGSRTMAAAEEFLRTTAGKAGEGS